MTSMALQKLYILAAPGVPQKTVTPGPFDLVARKIIACLPFVVIRC